MKSGADPPEEYPRIEQQQCSKNRKGPEGPSLALRSSLSRNHQQAGDSSRSRFCSSFFRASKMYDMVTLCLARHQGRARGHRVQTGA